MTREIHETPSLLFQNSVEVPRTNRSKLRKTEEIRKVYARRQKIRPQRRELLRGTKTNKSTAALEINRGWASSTT
jgi:hypothetical protein